MSFEKDSKENNHEAETFLAYNMSVSKIQMANMQYTPNTKEMCEVAVLGTLTEAYMIPEVYERVLQYMQEHDLYERYLRPILELQFNPPQPQQNGEGNGNGGSGQSDADKKEEKQTQSDNKQGGGVSTKTDKNKEISKKFIEDMFRIDDGDF